MKNKIIPSFEDAVSDIPDGATIMMHYFMGPGGVPQNLILALRNRSAKNLTIITQCTGASPTGLRIKRGYVPTIAPNSLIENGQVKKCITTWALSVTPNEIDAAQEAFRKGEIEIEAVPQGILSERIRAGAAGLGGVFSPVGVGTIIDKGKEKRVINGREYILEMPLRADYAFIRAFKADKFGNLIYRRGSRCFNPVMAMAANVSIAEVDHIVEVGELDPETVVTPHVFIDRIVEIPRDGLGRTRE
jgi:3-oxoacid CoA-transferase A subunit